MHQPAEIEESKSTGNQSRRDHFSAVATAPFRGVGMRDSQRHTRTAIEDVENLDSKLRRRSEEQPPSGSMTQSEFNAMLLVACDVLEDMIRGGCLNIPVYDVATFAAADMIDLIPSEVIEVCDLGSLEFLVR